MKIAVSAFVLLVPLLKYSSAAPGLRAALEGNYKDTKDLFDPKEWENPFKGGSPHEKIEVKGGQAKKVESPDFCNYGIHVSDMKGVKTISSKELSANTVLAPGLYVVDNYVISGDVMNILDTLKLTLSEDGTLWEEDGKTPVVLIYFSEVYEVYLNADGKENGGGRRLASPFPWHLYSWNFWWKYNGGFCRNYKAWSVAESWGPLYGSYRPHTNIEGIETSVTMAGITDFDTCSNCNYESSYREKSFGCFWPAIGYISGLHQAYWTDGWFSAGHSWFWN